ncbi:hypothetical protein IAU60_001674 [Kwoniella sp. DSM 27419]
MPRSASPARTRSRSRARSMSGSPSRSPVKRDRSLSPAKESETVTPFLIRVFVTKGKHTPLVAFDEGNFPLRDEFQVYGWKSSSPTSLIRLMLPSFPPPYRSPLARYSFRHIYVDASSRGLYRSKDLVSFTGRDIFAQSSSASDAPMDVDADEDMGTGTGENGNGHGRSRSARKKVEEKSLDEYGFVTGDLLSVSLYVPEPKIPAGQPAGVGAMAGAGAGGSGPGQGLGAGAGGKRDRDGAGVGGRQSFGWGERDRPAPPHADGREEPGVKGHWARGVPLPPQDFGAGARGGRGGEPAGGGRWRGGAPAPGGFGIRGGAARAGGPAPGGRRSPEYESGGRDGRRSRSPVSRDRRQSWSARR